jgi:tetratricopeptide (TPR) repeat protein
MKHTLRNLLVLLLLSAAFSAVPAAAVDPFYQSLLREGVLQYERGDFADASRSLRLACFGMLDEPRVLGGCLVRLALAQDRAGDDAGFQETFRRLTEVEERFQGYTRSDLPQEVRTALEQRLAARVPAATLRSIAAFRGLADRKTPTGEAPAAGTDIKRQRGQAAAPVTPPASSTPPAAVPVSAGPRPMTSAERDRMAQARKLLGEEGKVKELRQAFQLASEVADAHPESVEAQHLAAEAAYRVSRWADAARYFRQGGEPGEDQPELLFYMAVALYESGDPAGAAAVLKRALPNLQHTPYVDAYARKILG